MSKTLKTVQRGACLLLALLLLTCVFTKEGIPSLLAANTSKYASDSKVKQYQSQISSLQQQTKNLKNNIANVQKEAAEYRVQKKEIDALLTNLADEIELSEELIELYSNQIEDTKQEIAETQTEYDRKYRQFLDIMVLNYEEGDASYLALLLGADSLSDFLSRLENVTSILDYNKKVMEKLETLQANLQKSQQLLEQKVEEQQGLIVSLEEAKAEAEEQLDYVKGLIADLEKEEAKMQAQIKKNQAAEAEADAQIAKRVQELQAAEQRKMESGTWQWPIDLNVNQVCSSGYGWRILYGVWDFHRGWDIACAKNTPIHAAKGGKVLLAEYHYSYGNYIVIDNGDGVSTVYGHCTTLKVKAGQVVTKGQVIGTVGTTGNSTGFHLHFEFRKNGTYVDPYNYIKSPPISIIASKLSK